MDAKIKSDLLYMAVHDFDGYAEEARRFEWDTNIQIIGTMNAGVQMLSQEVDKDLAAIDKHLSNSEPQWERLTDERVDVLSMYGEQMRFLRNSALVSLTSRLLQALRRMAQSAVWFSPRAKGRYNDGRFGSKNEFKRLWNELEERFAFDMVANAALIDFLEPMVMARNQIVHEGSQVNVLKDDLTVDTSFSDAYPDYVSGTGLYVEVEAKEELLEKNFEAANNLVKWLAARLREKELEYFARNS
jgi:hypothetical protein